MLVVEELVTNSFAHGDAAGANAVNLSLAMINDSIEIRLDDNGSAFDPRADVPRDTCYEALEDRPVGGLGWPLIKHFCELLGYPRLPSDAHHERNAALLLLRAAFATGTA